MAAICTKEQMKLWRKQTDERIQNILSSPNLPDTGAKTYYVANDGCDENDGLSPERPWKTLDRVNAAPLEAGTSVRFKTW